MTHPSHGDFADGPFRLLLVDDSPADVRLAQEALREGGWDVELMVADDGIRALDLLKKTTATDDESQHPKLVLLDLNMPRKDGRQLLQEIKADPQLRRIPVVILSTSEATQDVRDCYDLGASAYISKPLDLDEFMAVMRNLGAYWFQTVTPVP